MRSSDRMAWMGKLKDEEQGIALVIAMLIMMVVLSLSVTIVQLATHEGTVAASDLKTIEAAQVVDTGFSEFMGYLPTTAGTGICTGWHNVPQVVLRHPYTTSYTLALSFKDASGNTVVCSGPTGSQILFDGSQLLKTATITATSSSGTLTKNSTMVQRKFQMFADLEPIYGQANSNAIYGAAYVAISNNGDIFGDGGQDNGNVYSGDDMGDCANPLNGGFEVEGDLFVKGDLGCSTSIGNYAKGNFAGDVNVGGNLYLGASCVGRFGGGCGGDGSAQTHGYVRVTGNATIDAQAKIAKTCFAQGTITGGSNCGTLDSSLDGTAAGVDGQDIFAGYQLPAVATQAYPGITHQEALDSARITGLGQDPNKILFTAGRTYTYATNAQCATALSDIQTWGPAGSPWDTGVPILVDTYGANCQWTAIPDLNIKGDLYILHDGKMTFDRDQVTGVGGEWHFYAVHVDEVGTQTDAVCDLGQDDVTLTGATFTDVVAYIQTPCWLRTANRVEFTGQAIAWKVLLNNRGYINFRPSPSPQSKPTGYLPTVRWQQELPVR